MMTKDEIGQIYAGAGILACLGVEKSHALFAHDADQRQRIEELEKQNAALREALRELHAVVCGECPSLLDEDSGGDARLALQIEEALTDMRRTRKGNTDAEADRGRIDTAATQCRDHRGDAATASDGERS